MGQGPCTCSSGGEKRFNSKELHTWEKKTLRNELQMDLEPCFRPILEGEPFVLDRKPAVKQVLGARLDLLKP